MNDPADKKREELQNIINGFGKPSHYHGLKKNNNGQGNLFDSHNSYSSYNRPKSAYSAYQSGIGSFEPHKSKYLSIYQANKLISNTYRSNSQLQNLYVTGEISSFIPRKGRNQMQFLTLSQRLPNGRTVQMDTCMYAYVYHRIKFNLKTGMNINVYGYWNLYSPNGNSSLMIRHLSPAHGVGALQLELAQRKAKLRKMGAFSMAHKKTLPQFPKSIAIITSETGQAIHDASNRIHKLCPLTSVTLYPALVQGANAPKSLIKQLKQADKSNQYDIIIICRGGGAIEDLQAFNDEKLAWAIYNCRTPTISAVGHKENHSISDDVADASASVPAQSGNKAVPDLRKIMKNVNQDVKFISDTVNQNLRNLRERLIDVSSSYIFKQPARIYQNQFQIWSNLSNHLDESEQNILIRANHGFQDLVNRLNQNSPQVRLNKSQARLAKLSEQLNTNAQQRIWAEKARLMQLSNKLVRHTPTIAISQQRPKLALITQKLSESMKAQLLKAQANFKFYANQLIEHFPEQKVADDSTRLHDLYLRLLNAEQQNLNQRRIDLKQASNSLNQLNYHNVLKRGYSISTNLTGSKVLTNKKDATDAKVFRIHFKDGSLPVVAINPKQAKVLLRRYHSTK